MFCSRSDFGNEKKHRNLINPARQESRGFVSSNFFVPPNPRVYFLFRFGTIIRGQVRELQSGNQDKSANRQINERS